MISRFVSFVIIFTTHLVDLVVPDDIMRIYRWNFRGYRTDKHKYDTQWLQL